MNQWSPGRNKDWCLQAKWNNYFKKEAGISNFSAAGNGPLWIWRCGGSRENRRGMSKYISGYGGESVWMVFWDWRRWSLLLHPTCKYGVPWGSVIGLFLLHSLAKMITFSPMTSNILLISKCFYPALTSPPTRLRPNCFSESVLRCLTGILSSMYISHLPSQISCSPSPCMYNTIDIHKPFKPKMLTPHFMILFLIIPHPSNNQGQK